VVSETDAPSLAQPFAQYDGAGYCRWRDDKLARYPALDELWVEIADPMAPTPAECDKIARLCRRANLAFYVWRRTPPDQRLALRAFAAALGLRRLDANPLADPDGVTSLRARPDVAGRGYVPYSNRALAWHTDGYYNPPEREVRAVVLHCVQPAAEGGANTFLDHEIAYLHLRGGNPAHVAALMRPDAMTIPANCEPGQAARPARSGPVFAIEDGRLHMRYTSRPRNIGWKNDPAVRAALGALDGFLVGGSPYHRRARLAAGQGVVSNNVLHNREAFRDEPPRERLVLRARYHDRVAEPA
jgi:Taurine catabolism dioxygenase TauD, TfdA family